MSTIKVMQIPISLDFSLSSFLCSDNDIRNWNLQGLPKDKFSTENALIVKRTNRWPLLVDPQQQANKWIRVMQGQKLKVIDMKMKNFLRILESAIIFGLPVLLQDLSEEIDASIEPLLRKDIVSTSGGKVIKLGDKDVDYNDNFELFMTTKLSNPHYLPEISVKTSIVNFSLKEKGLGEQLLALVVNAEEPSLENKKSQLNVSIATGQDKLIDLEDEILRLLSESKGSLLDDLDLIRTLESSKATAELINTQNLSARKTEIEIDSAREEYRSSARLSSIIYSTLNEISSINPMYQYSLDSYMDLFRTNIERSRDVDVGTMTKKANQRVKEINEYHILNMHRYICVGLFERDKFLFSLRLCFRILNDRGEIPKEEYDFFCYGRIFSKDFNSKTEANNLKFDWLSSRTCDSLRDLDHLIKGIVDSIIQQEESWSLWYKSDKPEATPLPARWDTKLSDMQKLCIIRVLRLDRVMNAATLFISKNIGSQFSFSPSLNLTEVLKTSTPKVPLILILSPGVDPAGQIATLAKSFSQHFVQVALGQGQAQIALESIRMARSQGFWVYLANCHLMLSWMKQLEEIIDCYNEKEPIHENYRLWLSSNPEPSFPLSILQRGIKISMEPPRGLRLNLLKLYSLAAPEDFSSCKQQGKYKKLLFTLSWFHSILLERRKFKTLGFNSSYDFNDSDYTICKDLLLVLLEEYPGKTPLEALKYMMGEAHYGGRVTDRWDRRLVNVYLKTFFCKDALDKDNFMLSDLPSYYIPSDGDILSYKSFIQRLPQEDDSEIFGQHPNAFVSSQIEESNKLLQTIISIQPRKNILINNSAENLTEDIYFEKLDSLPALFDLTQIQDIFLEVPHPIMLNTVLLQEAERYNCLLSSVSKTTECLRKAMKGIIAMTPDLERDLTSITNCRVPNDWLQVYSSCKPLDSWIADLHARIKQLQSWIEDGVPSVFWLGGFTSPDHFLSVVLQTMARNKGLAIDSLTWDFEVIHQKVDEIIENPVEGVYISGILLEGARWDGVGNHLDDPIPMELMSTMPIVHFRPTEGKKKLHDKVYSCPLYVTQKRIERITVAIHLDSGLKNPEHWIKRGVVMLLSTSE